jgi:hypothetical protein
MDELGVTTRLQLGAALVRVEYMRTQTYRARNNYRVVTESAS